MNWAAVLLALVPQSDLLHPVRVELTGPLPPFELVVGEHLTSWEGPALLEGESREVLLPLALPAPQVEAWPAGVRVLEEEVAVDPPAWLLRRNPPAVDRLGVSALGPSSALLLILGWVMVAALRRRPATALGSGLLVSGLLLVTQGGGTTPGVPLIEVLELESPGPAGRWGTLRVGWQELACPPLEGWLEAVDSAAPVRWSVSPSGWRVTQPAGGRLCLRTPQQGRGPLWTPDVQTLGELEEAWSREGGPWKGLGPWPLGPRPAEGPSLAAAPPGWLVAGLPMGRWALVGRLVPDPEEPELGLVRYARALGPAPR